jgi:hypothetical protein
VSVSAILVSIATKEWEADMRRPPAAIVTQPSRG